MAASRVRWVSCSVAGKTAPKDCEVRFKCDKGLTYKDYKGVYTAISNAGGIIAIMHELRK